MTLDVGQSLRGYQIREFIEEGGFATVYRAYQDSINRDVAIKVIDHDQIVKSVDFIRRFQIEAQIIARLEHPHIVPIYDFWREPERAFIVMRWLERGSIRNLFDEQSHIDMQTVSNMVSQIGMALQFVHERGVIHRDIKPENILVDSDINFYLTDFGIAIDTQRNIETEKTALHFGTPEYMSPEQIIDDAVTFKSDIYAFAVAIFEILTGHVPFTGMTIDGVLMKHVNQPFPSVRQFRPDLSPDIDHVLHHATYKSPEKRYDNILEFVRELVSLFDSSEASGMASPQVSSTTHIADTRQIHPYPTHTLMLDGDRLSYRNPYKGLQAFDEADANDFYGRTQIIGQMIDALSAQIVKAQPSFLAVIGASGSGKSSVVRAGLIPQLRLGDIDGSENWFYITMTPGTNPVVSLAEQFNSIAVQGHDNLVAALQTSNINYSSFVADMIGKEHIFLLVDQFEEVFTQVDDEVERKNFINLLARLIVSVRQLTVVITLRADFYDRPLAYRQLGELIQTGAITLLPMSSEELMETITEPADSVGCTVESNLVSQLVADTIHQPNALPLLQFTITELFEHREGNKLTLQQYEAMERIHGAIANRAERIYRDLTSYEQDIAQRLFLQLVNLSETNEAVRRRILWKDAIQITHTHSVVDKIVNLLSDNRLLTFDRDPISRQPTIEVAHEALIKAWARLQAWITENRSDLVTYHRLTVSVQDWLDNKQDASFLARDVELVQYESILDNPIINLNDLEHVFLRKSQSLRRRNQMIRYSVISILVVLTIASVVVSVIAIDGQNQANFARQIALDERDRANSEANIAQSRALAATSLSSLDDGRNALLLAVEAYKIADTFEARNSLFSILSAHQGVAHYHNQDMPIRDFIVTPDDLMMYAVGDSNEIVRWDSITSEFDTFAIIPDLPILNTISLNNEMNALAVGGQGGFAIVDGQTGEVVEQVERDGEVWSVVWSRFDNILYGVDDSGRVLAWDSESNDLLFETMVSTESLFAVALQPAEDSLVVGGANNNIYVLDTETGEILYEFEGHSNWIMSLAYSRDGQMMASGSADLSVIVWDMDDLQAVGQIPTRYTDWIRHVEFSSDGTQLLTSSADTTLKRWDVATGRQVGETLSRHYAPVWQARFVDATKIVSVDRSGMFIEWSLDASQFPITGSIQIDSQIADSEVISGFNRVAIATNNDNESASLLIMDLTTHDILSELNLPSFVTDMDYSQEANLLAIAGIDQVIRILDLSNPTELVVLGQHDSIISDIVFAPDGSVLYSGDGSGLLRRWDIETRTMIDVPLLVDESGLAQIIFSLDGQTIATVDRTGIIILWDNQLLVQAGVLTGGHDGVVTDIHFTEDGKTIYSVGRDAQIIGWDTDTATIDTVMPQVHTDWILDIALIDENTLVTTGRDSTIILWDIARRQPIGLPLQASSSDWGLSLLTDKGSRQVYNVHRDGSIVMWQFGIDEWIDHACEVANINTIPTEIQHLLTGSHPCIVTDSK